MLMLSVGNFMYSATNNLPGAVYIATIPELVPQEQRALSGALLHPPLPSVVVSIGMKGGVRRVTVSSMGATVNLCCAPPTWCCLHVFDGGARRCT